MHTDLLFHRDRLFARVQALVGVGLTILALYLAYALKSRLPFGLGEQASLEFYWTLFLLIGPLWYLLFELTGYYTDFWQSTRLTLLFRTLRLVGLGLVLILAILFLLRIHAISRLTLGLFALLDLTFILVWSLGLLYTVQLRAVRPYHRRRVLVVGDEPESPEIIAAYRGLAPRGFEVVGFVHLAEPVSHPRVFAGIPVLGTRSQLSEILQREVVDECVFAVGHEHLPTIRDDLMVCEERGIHTRIKSSLFSGIISKTRLEILRGIPLLTFSTTPQNAPALFVKEVLDRTVALLGLVAAAPLIALIALAIKLTSPGPVLFTQTRVGLNGRRFTFYKFRTMVANAPELRAALSDLNERDGPVFKIAADPRITWLGGLLRRTSLDELPQLFNVLRGEMSLIGPRPPLPEEVGAYKPWQRRRLSMKPGLTCIWQVSGRNEIPFERWMQMDLQYIDNWSLKLDLQLLLRPVSSHQSSVISHQPSGGGLRPPLLGVARCASHEWREPECA